jgi:hypothetical protein
MKRVLPALLCCACIDAAFDDYCALHNGCAPPPDAGCAPGTSDACPISACSALDGGSGQFWIDTRKDGGPPQQLECSVGWTLVGTTSTGAVPGWLVSETLTATVVSIDAVPLAMASTQLRLSASDQTRWIQWPLPSARTAATLWRGPSTDIEPVVVTAFDGSSRTCFQSATGVAWRPEQQGAYPATASDDAGTSIAGDDCVMVGFAGADGGLDAPTGDSDWPNAQLGQPASVRVWLR